MNGQGKAGSPKTSAVKPPVRTAPPAYQPAPAREVLQAKMMFKSGAQQKITPVTPRRVPAVFQSLQPKINGNGVKLPVATSVVRLPLTQSTVQMAARVRAGQQLLSTASSPPSTQSTQRWAKGILFYTVKGDEGDETARLEFGAASGTYSGDVESCQNKDGYKNRRKNKDGINHSCAEAHVLNWVDGILKGPALRKPSRLIMVTQETMCSACESDLVAFSQDHANTYVQVRSKSLYVPNVSTKASDDSLFTEKGSKKNAYKIYRPMVGGAYIPKTGVGAVRHLKIGP